MKFKFSPQIFKKYSNIKFHYHPSGGSQVVSCGQTGRMKVTVTFCNFANVPKNFLYNTQPLITRAMEVSFIYA